LNFLGAWILVALASATLMAAIAYGQRLKAKKLGSACWWPL
jgi:hypothetical protein